LSYGSVETKRRRKRKAEALFAALGTQGFSCIFQSALLLRNGGSPRCCPVLCGLRDCCIAAMLATLGGRPEGRDTKAELNRRSQACEVLTGTGIRVARNGRASGLRALYSGLEGASARPQCVYLSALTDRSVG